jgi:hypothetical protein
VLASKQSLRLSVHHDLPLAARFRDGMCGTLVALEANGEEEATWQ